MISFPSKDEWSELCVAEPLHRFLILAWEELFDSDTSDKWEVRTANLRYVLNELLDVAVTVEAHERYGHNVVVLLAEAIEMASEDQIIVKRFPFVADALRAADLLGADAKSMWRLRSVVRFILSRIDGYEELAASELRALIEENSNKKHEAHQLLKSLAVAWSVRGYSREFLATIGRESFGRKENTFVTRFDELVSHCSGTRRPYICRFAIRPPKGVPMEHAQDIRWQFTRGWPKPPWTFPQSLFYKRTRNEDLFADFHSDELDPWSATRRAAESFAELTAILQLYDPASRVQFLTQRALVHTKDKDDQLIKILPPYEAAIHPTRDPAKRIQDFATMKARLAPEDANELLSSLQYYRLALEADTSESRLVNLWIALETLCRRAGGSSIIDKICEYVVPGVTLNNLRRTVESIARYIQIAWKVEAERNGQPLQNLKPFFPRSSESTVDPADVLNALLAAPDTPEDDALYALIGEQQLICQRIFRAQENVFRSADRAASDLQRHARHVGWQIRRIYRARNQVMHQGLRVERLENLLRHLQTYLVLTFYNLIYDLCENPGWTLPDALQYRVFLYDQMMKRLADKTRAFPRAAILDPALILTGSTEEPAWR